MAFMLPSGLIMVDVILSNRGKTAVVPAAIDTGASGFGYIDDRISQELMLPLKGTVAFSGVGGEARQGWIKGVELAYVKENPDCRLANFQLVSTPDLGTDPFGIKMLVGEDFLKSTYMNLDPSPEGWKISCRKGPHVAIQSSTINAGTLAVVGGLSLIGVGLLAVTWFMLDRR